MIKIMKKLVIIAALVLFQCLSPKTQTDYVPDPEALHQAASLLDEARVRELINDYQFPIDQSDRYGWLPIHHAVFPDLHNLNNMSSEEQRIRQLSIINLLQSTLTIPTFVSGHSVMHLVTMSGNIYLAHVLHNFNNQLILMLDNRGNTPLHTAASFNQTPLTYYFIEILHMSVDTINSLGKTPLHCAIETGAQEAIIFLISHDASIYIPDHAGLTPLDYAEMCDRQHPELGAADSLTSLVVRRYMARHGNDLVSALLANIGMKTACSMAQLRSAKF